MNTGQVMYRDKIAGHITQTDEGYAFRYSEQYLNLPGAEPVSLTLPLQSPPFTSPVLFPFFDGLIPEGWLLAIVQENWKIDPRDRMELLLTCCHDCIGAVSVIRVDNIPGV